MDSPATAISRMAMAAKSAIRKPGAGLCAASINDRHSSAEQGACNAFVPACRSAATAAAQLYAPAFRQEERARRERITAYLLSDMLRPEEMARFAQYLRGEEGGRLLAAVAMLRQDDDRVQRRRRELERMLERTTPGAMADARAEFRRRSRNLPGAPPR